MSDVTADSVPDSAAAGWPAGILSWDPATSPPPVVPRLESAVVGLTADGSPVDASEPVLFVPTGLPEGPVRLVVLLHGAGSNPRQVLPVLRAEAERRKFLIWAPKSRGITWDALSSGGFGPDVEALDTALAAISMRYEVDPARAVIAGFSDGASYALTLGLINGSVFRTIFVFSGGYFVPGRQSGTPGIFVSHGEYDSVLPIEYTGREVVRALDADGYRVQYEEFDGGHEPRYDMVDAAFEMLDREDAG